MDAAAAVAADNVFLVDANGRVGPPDVDPPDVDPPDELPEPKKKLPRKRKVAQPKSKRIVFVASDEEDSVVEEVPRRRKSTKKKRIVESEEENFIEEAERPAPVASPLDDVRDVLATLVKGLADLKAVQGQAVAVTQAPPLDFQEKPRYNWKTTARNLKMLHAVDLVVKGSTFFGEIVLMLF
jgi:hypothetical protein